MLVEYERLLETFETILKSRGLASEDAHEAATVFADNSADGIYSHGVNRFPRVVDQIDRGFIKVDKKAACEASFGPMERWNGKEGLGPLNAKRAMDRAVALAKEHGIGLVALRNTNHWMRGGTYGWMAANQGCIGLCWTNTMPNMPAWGGKDLRIGNNPFIMAVPRSGGRHFVVDLAMSQFSYGKLEEHRLKGTALPVQGGYDSNGQLSTDAEEIEKTRRVLPIGFWKGSGMSIAFDLIASILAAGNSVKAIGEMEDEKQLSQVFIAIDPASMGSVQAADAVIDETLAYIKASEPMDAGQAVRYPGEREHATRIRSLEEGIPVIDAVWEKIQALAAEA